MALLRKFDEGGTTQDTEQQAEQTIIPPVTSPVTSSVAPPVTPQVTRNIGPLTIQVYGEDYDVNALTKSINAGIRPYLRSLRCKDKDKKFVEQKIYEIWDAMLEDVADGKRVTYNGTHFTDYKGILKNAPKEKKDFVGMAAWYVGNILDNATPIEKPKSYDYAPWLVGSVVLRRLFGTSAGDDVGAGSLQDWFLMDEPGEDNIRGTDNRAQRFRDVLQGIINDQHAFDEYNWSPENVQKARDAVQAALNAATQNGLDPTDYSVFATNLGRFGTGAQGWNTLFMGDTRTPAELAEEKTRLEEEQKKQKEEADKWVLIPDPTIDNPDNGIKIPSFDGDGEKIFEAWMDEKHPDTKKSKEYTCSKNTGLEISANKDILNNLLNGYSSTLLGLAVAKELKGIKSNIGNKIRSNTRLDDNAICWALLLKLYKKSNKQDIGENFSYIPEILWDGEENGVLYNGKNGTLRIVSLRKIPSWMDERRKEFRKIAADLGISFWKQGGILTFKKGGEVGKYQEGGTPEGFFSNLSDIIGSNDVWFDAEGKPHYSTRYRNNLVNGEIKQQERSVFGPAKDTIAPGNKHYNIEPGGKKTEAQPWWNDWITALTSNEKLAELWAREYAGLAAENMPHWEGWFEGNDKEKGKFNFENFKKTLPGTDKNLWSDAYNGIGHDYYRGKFYATKDENGNITSYGTSIPEGWQIDGDLLNFNPLLDVLYLTRSTGSPTSEGAPTLDTTPAPDTRSTGGEETSDKEPQPRFVGLNRVSDDNDDNKQSWLSKIGAIGDFPANLVGVSRLLTHLRGNRKVRDTLLAAQHPALKNTYELYSPVTGDFAAMLNANNLAAQTMRRLLNNQTADSNTNLSAMLDANSQANQLRTEGFLKDNQRIRETAEAALKRREDNIKRRSDVANENRAAINENNKTRAQIKADWQKKKTETVTNWLAEIQKNLHTQSQERQSLVREADNMRAYMDYQNTLQDLENKYAERDKNGAIDYTALMNNKDYTTAVRAAYNNYQQALLRNALLRRFYP